jgi:hypothetical protein
VSIPGTAIIHDGIFEMRSDSANQNSISLLPWHREASGSKCQVPSTVHPGTLHGEVRSSPINQCKPHSQFVKDFLLIYKEGATLVLLGSVSLAHNQDAL